MMPMRTPSAGTPSLRSQPVNQPFDALSARSGSTANAHAGYWCTVYCFILHVVVNKRIKIVKY